MNSDEKQDCECAPPQAEATPAGEHDRSVRLLGRVSGTLGNNRAMKKSNCKTTRSNWNI
uniref:Uncharacterized protein n=1 Tax=Anguilla anguilla TaxID=7936 RepID=A0A0E9RVI0_ANGAN